MMMRLPEGKHACSYCGEVLDFPPNADVIARLWATTPAAIVRSIVVDGEELHSCEVMPDDDRPLAVP